MGALRRFALSLALPLLAATVAAAQGVQTGEVSGAVRSSDGLTLPGASVSVQGPALQGVRTVVADVNGTYVVRALPPGTYTLTFAMSGLTTRTETVVVELGRQSVINASLTSAAVTENVDVKAEVNTAALTSPTVGANYTAREINQLPTGRTPALVAELAPGVTANTPNTGQVAISGGFAYDNVFMINGVDVNDNLFGSAAATSSSRTRSSRRAVLTSGISAEYGRFSGGVINMITKSGGNTFSGSFRSNFSNTAWTVETPREKDAGTERPDKVNQNYEATLGGPIVRDRLWFFGAGRWQDTSQSETLPETNLPFDTTTKNTRFEIKGTGTIARGHTVQANYIRDDTDQTRLPFDVSIDPTCRGEPDLPEPAGRCQLQRRAVVHVCSPTSRSRARSRCFRGSGGFETDIHASPFFTQGAAAGVPGGLHYNGNYFDATDPEDRDNLQYAGSLSYYLTTAKAGSHDIKGGVEHFTSNQTGGNSQSATGYVFDTDYVPGAGGPAFDASGRIIPTFVPGVTQLENWLATRGANLDIRTLSFYAQDNWTVNRRLTLNLGVRHERVRSEATGGIIGVDTDTTVPRLAATFDLLGDGRTFLQASVRALRRQVQRGADRPELARRQPGAGALRLHRPGGRGPRLRTRLRSLELRDQLRLVPDREHLPGARPVVAGHPRVQRVDRARSSATAAWRS